MTIEETRRRNEASMARKRAHAKAINPAAANSGISDGPLSPSSTGAMDSLLEKLRAAAPQARDQRDRRRRARLKDRHQVRVASGQTMPDLGDMAKGSDGDEMDVDGESSASPPTAAGADGSLKAGEAHMDPISEGEDVADRAASMLQGLRGDDVEGSSSGRPSSRDGGSLRVRRRRESADDERRNRRRRRGKDIAADTSIEANATDDNSRPGTSEGPIPEEDEEDDEMNSTLIADNSSVAHEDNDTTPKAPRTMISPPSPEPTAHTGKASINSE